MELDTIMQGDCLSVMRSFPDKSVDLIVTDPPYGIGIGGSGRIGGSGIVAPKQYIPVDWDDVGLTQEQWNEMQRISKNQIVFGFNHLADILGKCAGIIVWDKKVKNGWDDNFSDCEVAYSSIGNHAKVYHHLWMGALRASETSSLDRVHPTQKPIAVMEWIINHYSADGDLILDPFCGSGTTCVAAKRLKRHWIGIELEPKYVEIARRRVEQCQEPMF